MCSVVYISGAVGVAAILNDSVQFRDNLVACVICGGNLTIERMNK